MGAQVSGQRSQVLSMVTRAWLEPRGERGCLSGSTPPVGLEGLQPGSLFSKLQPLSHAAAAGIPSALLDVSV